MRVSDKAVYKLLGATNTGYKGNDDSPGNKIYIRFADVLLWKAEAYNETGSTPQAIAIINKIRAAGADGRDIAGTRTSRRDAAGQERCIDRQGADQGAG